MISPILPAHDADTIALDFGVFIAEHARTYRTSQSAIIAALRPCIIPSQPEQVSSHAPAADTPAVPPASEATDGEVVTLQPLRSVAPSIKDRILAAHRANPGFTRRMLADHLGLPRGTVSGYVSVLELKVPTQAQYEAAQKAKVAEELKAAAEPVVAREPEPAPELEPELPPKSQPSERLRPPPEADATDVLHRVKRAPSGRFYLRDKTTLEYVHQSLQPAAVGDGPMMTTDRKWAWFDTMDRYRGAKKRWPQIAALRKEAISK